MIYSDEQLASLAQDLRDESDSTYILKRLAEMRDAYQKRIDELERMMVPATAQEVSASEHNAIYY